MKIVIVGLGLIGGSLAKALSYSKKHEIFGFDTDEQSLLDAESCGAISRKGNLRDLSEADLIYICLYPHDVVKFTEEHGSLFRKTAIVSDVCGIKNGVVGPMNKLAEKYGFTFISGHPMAGKETNSFKSSDSGIFLRASYILIKGNAPDAAVKTMKELAEEMNFGRVIMTDEREHDMMIAFTSQLPHVLACAYVMSPRCEKHDGFSAGSYRDVSRVANINEELWSDLFLSNRESLCEELDTLVSNIGSIKDAVKNNDRTELVSLLRKAREIKQRDK